MTKKQSFWLLKASIVILTLVLLYIYLIPVVDFFIYDLAGLSAKTKLGQSIHFFCYDTLKILILLFAISSLMGVVNVYLPVERLRVLLTTRKWYGLEYLIAALFGAITPFCSCSSIPLCIGFVRGGIPIGITFSFLITSPLVNEVAVAMFFGLFGLKITLIYAISGVLMGTVGGFILGKFKLERFLADWVKNIERDTDNPDTEWNYDKRTFIERLPGISLEGWKIVKGVLLYVIIGIGIGAAMHGYVPQDFFTEYLSTDKWYAVPLAVILAVPMYANAAGIVPVIQVFVAKGVPLGTALAFMMAVVGLSLPEATLLKKVMTWKLIGIFFASITLFIILLGYLFNIIL